MSGEAETLPWPAPQERADLRGHAGAEQQVLDAWNAGRMPHAWLITGPKGVGKATLAYRIARFALAGGGDGGGLFGGSPETLHLDADTGTFRRVAAGSHADLTVLACETDAKTGRMRKVITVEQARGLLHRFAMTAGEGGWRVAIIDTVDDMNPSAANALLKLLEEPPPRCLLLLLADAPGGLLPTIRSRCRRLTLRPLADADVAALVLAAVPEAEDGMAGILRLAQGSPGRAMRLAAGGGAQLHADLVGLVDPMIRPGNRLDLGGAYAMGERFQRPDGLEAFILAFEVLADWLAGHARAVVTGTDEGPGPGRLAPWIALWEKTRWLADRTEAVNLDRRQAFVGLLTEIERTAHGG